MLQDEQATRTCFVVIFECALELSIIYRDGLLKNLVKDTDLKPIGYNLLLMNAWHKQKQKLMLANAEIVTMKN